MDRIVGVTSEEVLIRSPTGEQLRQANGLSSG
jgi:hypothetical protein